MKNIYIYKEELRKFEKVGESETFAEGLQYIAENNPDEFAKGLFSINIQGMPPTPIDLPVISSSGTLHEVLPKNVDEVEELKKAVEATKEDFHQD